LSIGKDSGEEVLKKWGRTVGGNEIDPSGEETKTANSANGEVRSPGSLLWGTSRGWGPGAATLLREYRPCFLAVVRLFLDTYDRFLEADPDTSGWLFSLSAEERGEFGKSLSDHLLFVFDPATTRAAIAEEGERLGAIHALSGIVGGRMMRENAFFNKLLVDCLEKETLSPTDRYRLHLVATLRLQEDLQARLRGESRTTETYYRTFSAPLPPPSSRWEEVRLQELADLGALPGIRSVLLLRPDSEGTFFVEECAGPEGETIALFFQSPGTRVSLDTDRSKDRSILSRVWRTQTSETVSSLATNPDHPWFRVNQGARIRSLLEIALSDASGRPVAVLGLGGAYPNQFGSSWMKHFAQTTAYRWSQLGSICAVPEGTPDLRSSTHYRTELFSGGLSIAMQPVVDLRTGRMAKVEALARLTLPNGESVSPAIFLPLLGQSELDRLFRKGLDMSLEWVSRWESLGLEIGVSVNLPPGTLRHPSCSQWVEEALSRHSLPPSRLTLEILENQEILHKEQQQALRRLASRGIRIAMDDVGSGYSSLERFSLLPFDTLKVDQKLLSRIRTIPLETMGLLWAIIQIGREFGREVVVEGLEDDGMIESTLILGAGFGQGYRIARPMPAELIPALGKSVILSAHARKITTYLGALAFQWKILHGNQAQNQAQPPLDDCPITEFFEMKNLEGSAPDLWHRKIHAEGSVQGALNQKLISWLVEKIKEERSPGP
jgi:EAL domain-containing protein (putative c-di-GMP-specific phosphodiesterase class I)